MGLYENIRLAIGAIRVNKLRSFLTMLGIIIGISSVITITTIGNSLQKTIANTLNELSGGKLMYIQLDPNYPEDEADWATWEYPELTDEYSLTYERISAYKEAMGDSIKHVLVQLDAGTANISTDYGEGQVSVIGVTEGYADVNRLEMVAGRDISEKDNDEERASCVVSDLFVKYVLGLDESPIGKKIDIPTDYFGNISAYIVGVYHYDDKKFGTVGTKKAKKDIITPIVVPYTYLATFSQEDISIDYFQAIVSDEADVAVVKEDTLDYFNNGLYKDSEDWSVSVSDMASSLSIINTVLTVITVAVSIIAGISLVVGGVGVMNIMLISVMERTREIGIRKALGALNRNIRSQFLVESIILCLIGGTIGILIGLLNGVILSKVAAVLVESYASDFAGYLTVSVSPSIPAIVVSVGFSVLIGVAFGYYPANRAAQLEPIDALRYE